MIETPAFLTSAAEEGISEGERAEIVVYIAANPDAGEIMSGTGGARKVRVAGRGRGKRGGFRVVTFYAAYDIPVFLLDVYSKSSQGNLSMADRNELRKVLSALPRVWREQTKSRVAKLRRPR